MSQKTGRNEPCPCGSGKKYKRCCLERDEDARRELAQQTLWDDDDAPEEADWLDDEVPPPISADKIVTVRYSRGMVKSFDLEPVVKAHRQQGGTCDLCGTELRRNSAIRHLAECAPAHDARTGAVQTLVHLRVTAPGLAGYWLDLEARDDARLEAVDRFLRNVWVECCGHLSAFNIGNVDYSSAAYESAGWPAELGGRLHRTMNARLCDALPGSGGRFKYEYDFGSTTTLQLEVKGERTGRLGRAATRLLARNAPLIWPCATCGEPASVVCAACIYESANPFVCKQHSRGRHACGESEMFLPVVNSPRMGICGYAG